MGFITFKTIGESGNLGSQLQQYSCLFAIAKETGRNIIFPESSVNLGFGFKFANLCEIKIVTKPDSFFDEFIDIKPDDSQIVDSTLIPKMDPQFNYNIVNRFDLFKYWYPKYFKDIMSFKWNSKYQEKAYNKYKSLIPSNKEIVAMHVRRGDYLLPQHSHFCQLDESYYSQALNPFIENIENYHFLVFSNDIEWCKRLIQGEMVTFVDQGDDYTDLITMSMCDHFIIANSSYSWWAAFKSTTNSNKKVYCPTNYLRDFSPWSHTINKNYYPSTWNNINNPT